MGSMFENTRAFAPFYADPVAVEGVRENGRKVSGTFRACVFELGLDDPLADESAESRRKRVDVFVRRDDWPDDEPPQAGFAIFTEMGDEFRIERVEPDPLGWKFKARSAT